MTRLESQIRELSPSVKDALFRRLLFAEDLAWLRDEKKKDRVIGFEVELDGQELSGFALIAIQRHTVIAFVSDRDESPRLILFPTLETLFDPGFELLNLIVTRKEFKDATFHGISNGHGRFGDMVKRPYAAEPQGGYSGYRGRADGWQHSQGRSRAAAGAHTVRIAGAIRAETGTCKRTGKTVI